MTMNFMNVGRLSSQMKNFRMEVKWKERKKNNDFEPDKSIEIRMLERMREEQRTKDYEFEAIKAKLYVGKSLTAQEMDYLSKKDPQMYQKAKEIENERKRYEKELENCKTKEEVERMEMSHISSVFSNVQSIVNNPVIPLSKKLELVMHEKQRMEAIKEATMKFVESGEYAKLPTEAEKNMAEQEIAEAEREEQEQLEEPKEEIEEPDNKDDMESSKEPELELGDGERTKEEAEQTPEARKAEYARNKKENQRQKYDDSSTFILNSIGMEWKA